jgi:hypothetical protein
VIVLGVIAVIIGLGAAGQMGRGFGGGPSAMAYIGAVIPGFGIAFAGFMGLVVCQIGRAGVDSAEYGQQSLKIARDQLEISKQGLKQGSVLEQGYAALQSAKEELKASSRTDMTDVSTASFRSINSSDARTDKTIEYKEKTIRLENGSYVFAETAFSSLEAAQRYIDQLGVNPNARLTGATRL